MIFEIVICISGNCGSADSNIYFNLKRGENMKKIEMFSKKLGKTIPVRTSNGLSAALGWTNSGWSKSGGWKKPTAIQ